MTTKEKITKAFKEIRKNGYFARQNFLCCQSCGWASIPEQKVERAVFYHRQDNESFVKGGDLFLAWSGDGDLIKKILEDNGLKVKWDGTKGQRISVVNE